MRKDNNFIFITNVQQGACLLFDRKGLGHFPAKGLKVNQRVKGLLNLVGRFLYN
jgi:hypothetical protein